MITFRPLQNDAEYVAHCFIDAYAFNGDRTPEGTERRRPVEPPDTCFGAFDGDELIAGLAIAPMQLYINGAPIDAGGIGSVSCLPEHRRAGHVAGLLKYGLQTMFDRGQVLSGLFTPHHALYGRYGWEASSRVTAYSFEPKAVALRHPRPAGTIARATADDWPLLQEIYTQRASHQNLALVRDEAWWRHHVIGQRDGKTRDVAVWRNAAGDARGYIVYMSIRSQRGNNPWGETTFRVFDYIALDGDAYTALIAFAAGHDLSDKIMFLGPADEPINALLEEPDIVEQRAWFGVLLRIVDVQKALEARPALPHASGASLTIAVTDSILSANEATWHIDCREARVSVETTHVAADIEMDVRALAPLFAGATTPSEAARTGAIRINNAHALDAATAIFAANGTPFCHDDY